METAPAPAPNWAVRAYQRHRAERALAAAELQVVGVEVPHLAVGDRVRQERVRQWAEGFERRYGFLPTPEKSVQKLTSIYEGHPLFFRALAWFVGRGHRLVFLQGNHDLEIYWPQVQERLRAFVAREYPAASDYDAAAAPLPSVVEGTAALSSTAEGAAALPPTAEGHLIPADLEERIVFPPGWFYYRPGVFYAEHGCQQELLNACPNPIRPLMPGDECVLSPEVGRLGVLCFHNHLENEHPEWENRTDTGVVLLEMIRRDPFKMLSILIRHAPDFIRMAQRLWRAGREEDLEPNEEDIARCAESAGLEPEVVRKIYRAGEKPLLLRRGLAWFLFSPGGHGVKALLLLALAQTVVGLGALWYLVVVPRLADLIPPDLLYATVGPALQLLARIALWLAPPVVLAIAHHRRGKDPLGPFLFEGLRRVHAHLREEDPGLRYYVAGHDHRPDVRPIERREDGRHVYYLNTGSWTPCLAEGERRLQTLGREVQFTFARLAQGEEGYEADLLRWNDDAGRADPQVVPLSSEPR
jgi:UDP-2,3-diacylglucosamine pyrophosphatase LpxH